MGIGGFGERGLGMDGWGMWYMVCWVWGRGGVLGMAVVDLGWRWGIWDKGLGDWRMGNEGWGI